MKILTIFTALVITLNLLGFCFSKLTYLGSGELIAIALDSQVKMDKDILPKTIKTAADFLAFKPSCCNIGGSTDPVVGFFSSLVGCRQYTVSVGYEVWANNQRIESASSFYIDHCGKVLEVEKLRAD